MFRLYLDTSVFGGCHDFAAGFVFDSTRILKAIYDGEARLLYSAVLVDELAAAPDFVRELFERVPPQYREPVALDDDAITLAEAYLEARIVSEKWRDDCLHVAAATVARADAIVSWNFKHIVRLDKIRAFNAVNLAKGFGLVQIVSPKEVRFDDADRDSEA